MRFLPLLLLAFSTTATAREADDPSLAPYFTHEGGLALEAPIELQLYSRWGGGHHIETTLESGDRYLFEVVPGEAFVYLSAGFAKAAGAEMKDVKIGRFPRQPGHVRGDAIEISVGTLDALVFGDLVLTDVAVFTPEQSDVDKLDLEEDPDTTRYGGILGLNHLADVSWALLPSQGVLKLSPSSGTLVEIDSAAVQTHYEPAFYTTRGEKQWFHGARPIVIDGTVDGREARIAVSGLANSSVASGFVADREADWARGPHDYHTMPFQVGHVAVDAAAYRVPLDWMELPIDAVLGQDYTWAWDWAYDAATEQLAMAWIGEDNRKTWSDTYLAEMTKALTPEPDPETGEPAEAPEGDALASIQLGIAAAHDDQGDLDAELAALQAALEAAPEDCNAHGELGVTLLDYGRAAEAIPHLERAGELWDAWDSQDPWERESWVLWVEDLEEGSKKARLKASWKNTWKLMWKQNIDQGLQLYWVRGQIAEREEAGLEPLPTIQSNECDVVWGALAFAKAAVGDLEGVEALYAERLDYDGSLALALGNARLAAGDVDGAHEAYRQLEQLGWHRLADMGLALVQLSEGQDDAALTNMQQAVYGNASNLHWLRQYYLSLGARIGPSAAADQLLEMAETWPENPTFQLAAAEASLHAGQDASGWVERAVKSYEYVLMGPTWRVEYRAQYAAALALAERVADARAAALEALERDPAQGTALTTLGLLAAIEGDDEASRAYLEQARVANVFDPTFAVMRAN